MKPYSYSKVNTFMECPLKYKFQYIDRLPRKTSKAAEIGSKIHEAISYQLKGQYADSVLALDVEDYYEAERKVEAAVNLAISLGKPLAIEQKFSFSERETPTEWSRSFFRGIFDLVVEDTGGISVWDWKTGHVRPTAMQISLYAYYAEKVFGKPLKAFGYVLLNTNEIMEVNRDFIPISIEKMKYTIGKIENAERSGEFKAKPDNHCMYCDFVDSCPLGKTVKEKNPVKLLDKIIVQKALIKSEEKALKEYVDNNGDIPYNGKMYGIEYSHAYRRKKGVDFQSLLRELALSHPEAVKFDNQTVYKYYPQYFEVSVRKNYLMKG